MIVELGVIEGRSPPLPAQPLLPLLAEPAIEGLIFTQYPVHPPHLKAFNKELYSGIARGQSVAQAAQGGRSRLRTTPMFDHASFGAFATYVAVDGGLQLSKPPLPSAQRLARIGNPT